VQTSRKGVAFAAVNAFTPEYSQQSQIYLHVRVRSFIQIRAGAKRLLKLKAKSALLNVLSD